MRYDSTQVLESTESTAAGSQEALREKVNNNEFGCRTGGHKSEENYTSVVP